MANRPLLLALLLLTASAVPAFGGESGGHAHDAMAAKADARQFVKLPPHLRKHMMANMRDHLMALESITRLLSAGRYDDAADMADKRLGLSSIRAHGGNKLAPFMPKGMLAIGKSMHQAASRFVITARNAGVEQDPSAALDGLSKVMQRCVACHASYRVH